MRMNALTLALPLVLAAACTPPEFTAIRINNVRAPSEDCSGGEGFLARGILDLALTREYVAMLEVDSNMQQLSTTVGRDTIAGPERNDFVIKEVIRKYTLDSGALPDETHLYSGTIRAGSQGNTVVTLLVGSKAAEALQGRVQPGGASAQLVVTVSLKGNLASGSQISSNGFTFPITVVNTGTCPDGSNPKPGGPLVCGNPQDSVGTCE